MKNIIFSLTTLLISASAYSQDIIVKTNGDELQAKVAEIGDTSIKYRKFSNPNGPMYSIASSEVFIIRFENGTREVFTPAEEPEAATSAVENGKYESAQKAVLTTKKPLRDKRFYVRPMASFGYGCVLSGDMENFGGLQFNIGASAEWFPNDYKIAGLYTGLQYSGNSMTDTNDTSLDISYMNWDVGVVYRDRKSFYSMLGWRLGIPVSAKYNDRDMIESCKVTIGIAGEFGWSLNRHDLGLGLACTLNKVLKDTDSTIFGFTLNYGYRF